jgi:hypothetical protein
MRNLLNCIKCFILLFTVLIFTKLWSIPVSQGYQPIDRMPLVQDDPFEAMASNLEPKAERDASVRKWLEPGVRIAVKGARGSGTIVYYDEKSGYAYVQSCGHLWKGDMSAATGKKRRIKCNIDVFYKNGQRLQKPATYSAEVLFYYNNKNSGGHLCQDVSLSRFKPDFVPKYFPIASAGTQLQQGEYLHSVGCDHATEVAHYKVRVIGERGGKWPDLVTTENSPRPGRSGGGLISDDEVYVGICWGTSSYDGKGNGFFTPLRTVRHFNEQEGYGWLNDVGTLSPARSIPIIDRNNRQNRYPDKYIPLPGGRF